MTKLKSGTCAGLTAVAVLGFRLALGGDAWIPLRSVPFVEPGSAADCSSWAKLDAPAGKHGYARPVGDGFEFERLPGVRQRFLGACVINGAVTPADDAASAAFAAMIPRLGWNAVRIHQHEMSLVGPDGYALAPDKMRRFDRFVADLIARGVYLTTDLYVTRKVPGKTLQGFKESVLFDEHSFSNYLGWAKAFLQHRNEFTGRTYAEEPALFSIALVNEGNVGNDYRTDRPVGWELAAAAAERRFVRRMRKILRDELGCRAMISDFSGWTFKPEYEPVIREEYDYYDFHGYNDHPIYVAKKFHLPSRMRARDLSAYFGVLDKSEMRKRLLPVKPAMMTEWSWSAPGHYRHAGGLVQAVYMANRGVDGLFHYAWGSFASGDDPFGTPEVRPRPISYWDMSRDPLALAAERAVSALYLRGDLTSGSTFTNDVARNRFAVTTAATVGLADAGHALWQSSCDGRPLAETGRILVTHLADLVNTGMKLEDWEGRPTLLTEWGTLPYLLRRHVAPVELKVRPGAWRVWRLETSGRRRSEVACRYADGVLRFVADNGADPANATILYEAVDERE